MAYIRSRKHANSSHLLALVAAALPVAAGAQEAEQTLPTTTVTATADTSYKADFAASRKFTAPLVDTPKTVTVVTQEVLEQTNAASLKEALRTVTGITFAMGEGGSPEGDNPVIRGFNAQANTYIDGLRDPSSQSRNMFAIEQIDVVKGADSAFSGGGAVGGSINLTTKSAKLANFGEASAGIGTDGYYRTTVDLNRQFSETGALRINLLKEGGDVPGRDSVDYDHLGANVSAAFGLGTPTRVIFGLYHYETDDMPDYGIPYNNPYTAGTANAVYNGDGGPLNVDRSNFYGLTSRDFRKTTMDSGTIKFEHDLNDQWTLRNATRISHSLNDYVATNPGDTSGVNLTPGSITVSGVTVPSGYLRRSAKSRHSVTDGVINATDVNGEFFTGAVKHNIAVGFEVSHLETDSRNYIVSGTSLASISDPNASDVWTGTVVRNNVGTKYYTTTRGIYLFDTLTFTKQWLLNLGVREDWFSTKADTYSTDGYASGSTTTAFTPASVRSDVSFASYQGGLVFKPRDNGSIYLNYATAANPSGISAGDGSDNLGTSGATLSYADLEPEKIRNLELGTKWNLFGNRLTLTGAVFELDKTNAKVQIDATTYETVGRQETRGFELGFAGALSDRWQVFGGYTYLHSVLAEVGPYASNQVIKGKQFPNTPEHSFSLWSTYKPLAKLTVGGGAYYVSKVYGNTANTKWVPEYWLFDAMASYQVDRQLTLRLNVTNLFDKTYYDRAYVTHMVSVGAARQAVLTANYKF
jgi:catecholate siderophore receptor